MNPKKCPKCNCIWFTEDLHNIYELDGKYTICPCLTCKWLSTQDNYKNKDNYSGTT